MTIRAATTADLDDVMRIYDAARRTMRANGNLTQWVNGYPSRSLVEGDISRGECFVVVDDASEGAGEVRPHGVFMFAVGDDPTYDVIEGGSWLNDEPYGVIHRIASDGTARGVLAQAVAFGRRSASNLRIDTHADNTIMRAALQKEGFAPCGTIYCQDGSPRIAFQLAVD